MIVNLGSVLQVEMPDVENRKGKLPGGRGRGDHAPRIYTRPKISYTGKCLTGK